MSLAYKNKEIKVARSGSTSSTFVLCYRFCKKNQEKVARKYFGAIFDQKSSRKAYLYRFILETTKKCYSH
jgi:hypothetical protein